MPKNSTDPFSNPSFRDDRNELVHNDERRYHGDSSSTPRIL